MKCLSVLPKHLFHSHHASLFLLRIRRKASEKYYRDGAKKVNEMWKQLSEIDGDKSPVNTKLAVIALKFASQLYRTMEKASETVSANERKLADTSKMLDEFEHQLDDILINTK